MTNKEINEIVLNFAKEYLTEDKRLLNEVKVLKDNFDFWIKYIDKRKAELGNNPDLIWFIQLHIRRKDNPGVNIPNYHAGAGYGTLSTGTAWIVRSGDELKNLRNEIVRVAEKNNGRAIIYANPRSEKDINSQIPGLQQGYGHNVPSDPRYQNAKEIALGRKYKDPKTHPFATAGKFDVDISDPDVKEIARIIVKHFDPKCIFYDQDSPSGGLHIGVSNQYASYMPKMIKYLRILDRSYNPHTRKTDFFPNLGRKQLAHFNEDADFILYSNVNTPGY